MGVFEVGGDGGQGGKRFRDGVRQSEKGLGKRIRMNSV